MQVAEAEAGACQLPTETGAPLSRRSCPELAAEPTARGITDSISASTVRRRPHQDAIKPWKCRSWIFIRHPNFRATAQRFQWKFTTSGLDDLPAGLDRHTADHPEESCVALAA